MRLFATLPLVLLFVVSSFLAAIPATVVAQEATPVVPVAESVFPPVNVGDIGEWLLPTSFCGEGNASTTQEAPFGGALVRPSSAPNQDLYFLEVTLPAGACVGYGDHYLHDGAIVWFVQKGTITFKTQLVVGLPAADVEARSADGSAILVEAGREVDIPAGGWISVDRAANYSYRNDGTEDAIILMAVLETRPAETMLAPEPGAVMTLSGGGCKTRCRDKK